MNLFEMNSAVEDAKAILERADSVAEKIARMLVGRLRKVSSSYVLSALKRELRDYNIHTGAWRE